MVPLISYTFKVLPLKNKLMVQKMGKVFGLISLLLGLASIILIWFFFPIYLIVLPILAIVFGGVGIAKDDSKALGIVGLILGIVAIILWWLIIPLLFLGALFSLIP